MFSMVKSITFTAKLSINQHNIFGGAVLYINKTQLNKYI